MRLGVKVGQGCAAPMNERMRDLNCTRLEMDEIWGFVCIPICPGSASAAHSLAAGLRERRVTRQILLNPRSGPADSAGSGLLSAS
jgi:hypothetical protein